MCGNLAAMAGRAMPVCFLAARRATYGSYKSPLDGPFRRVKNGHSQRRRPGCTETTGEVVCSWMCRAARKEVREYHFKLNLIKESFSMVIGKQSVKLMQYAIMRLMT